MGEDRLPGDERPGCCGHERRLHTPTCQHYVAGTRLEPPSVCGCDGKPREGKPRDGKPNGALRGSLRDPSDRPDVSG